MKYKIKPYEWQLKAINMADNLTDLALLADMGTGKSGAVVNILRGKYIKEKRLKKTLILGPVAVTFNWEEEITKHSNVDRKNIQVLHKSGGARQKMFLDFVLDPTCGELNRDGIVVANYEAMNNNELLKLIIEWKPEILICDESHLLKNPKAKRSKNVFKIASLAEHRYILTGTPILNSPIDIFMQYKILDLGQTFGTNFFVFRNKYFEDVNAKWSNRKGYFPKFEPRKELFPHLTNKIYSKAIRVMKSECLDLPDRVLQTVHCPLSNEQRKAYLEMKRDFITYLKSEQAKGTHKAVVANLAVTKALRLMQIVTGHVTTEDGEIIDFGEKIPRLETTRDLLEQITPNHKVIIWCSFIHNYEQLKKLCKKLNIKYEMITGKQSAKEKQESMVRFRSDDSIRVMIANRRAGGTGINLVEASYSIVYSRNFSLAEEKQSEDRNYRGGSQIHNKIVKIDLCTKDTIDELCVQALKNKQDISKKIVDIAKDL